MTATATALLPIGAPAVNARRDYRCACGALHFRAYLPPGAEVQIRCWRSSCKRLVVYRGAPDENDN